MRFLFENLESDQIVKFPVVPLRFAHDEGLERREVVTHAPHRLGHAARVFQRGFHKFHRDWEARRGEDLEPDGAQKLLCRGGVHALPERLEQIFLFDVLFMSEDGSAGRSRHLIMNSE